MKKNDPNKNGQGYKQEEKYHEVSGIRMGNAKVPKFLIGLYLFLGIWAVGYAFFATPINDRLEASGPTGKANAPYDGETIVQQNCTSCHNVTQETLVGPGLAGVSKRLTDEQLHDVLMNGRGQMPALPNLGLDTEQIREVMKYLKTL
ncbi:c-type cytochrome [Brevibacillus dissolubilis]|uniref:c-type cytochrome n=1 Tax=Brevibacillus dissolubilis TaxID=1844116 RepID=UPI00111636CB|nr:cytochrome c [Brevibacillus dissolubilis]